MKKDLLIFVFLTALASVYFITKNEPAQQKLSNSPKVTQLTSLRQHLLRPHKRPSSEAFAFVTGAVNRNDNLISRDRIILNMDPQAVYEEEDLRILIDFIAEPAPGEGSQLAYHSLKNNTMSFLIETEQFQEELAEQMLSTMQNPETHQVWREYIAQYLPDLYAKLDPSNSLDLHNQIIDALSSSTEETVGALAGTALMGLQKLQKTTGLISEDKVIELASQILNNPQIEVASQMGSIVVLADYDHPEVYETIHGIALDPNESITLRMAAINSAYRLQGKDQQWLNDFQQNFDPEQSDKRLLMVINNLIKQ
jgi:hypothetical protein